MTREKFEERIERCFVTRDEFQKQLQQLFDLGLLNDERIAKMEDNFLPIYAVVTAIYEKEIGWLAHGGSEEQNRRVRRMANYYK